MWKTFLLPWCYSQKKVKPLSVSHNIFIFPCPHPPALTPRFLSILLQPQGPPCWSLSKPSLSQPPLFPLPPSLPPPHIHTWLFLRSLANRHLLRQALPNLLYSLTIFYCLPTCLSVPHWQRFMSFFHHCCVLGALNSAWHAVGAQYKGLVCTRGAGLTCITAAPSEPALRLTLCVLAIFKSLGKQPCRYKYQTGGTWLGAQRLRGPVTAHPFLGHSNCLRLGG